MVDTYSYILNNLILKTALIRQHCYYLYRWGNGGPKMWNAAARGLQETATHTSSTKTGRVRSLPRETRVWRGYLLHQNSLCALPTSRILSILQESVHGLCFLVKPSLTSPTTTAPPTTAPNRPTEMTTPFAEPSCLEHSIGPAWSPCVTTAPIPAVSRYWAVSPWRAEADSAPRAFPAQSMAQNRGLVTPSWMTQQGVRLTWRPPSWSDMSLLLFHCPKQVTRFWSALPHLRPCLVKLSYAKQTPFPWAPPERSADRQVGGNQARSYLGNHPPPQRGTSRNVGKLQMRSVLCELLKGRLWDVWRSLHCLVMPTPLRIFHVTLSISFTLNGSLSLHQ